jgi:Fe-S cluster biogenesis protein NfuA
MNDKPEIKSELYERVALIIEQIRPYIRGDGGDIVLLDVENSGRVVVQLRGACTGCPHAAMTLKMGVERTLKEQIAEVTEVVAT